MLRPISLSRDCCRPNANESCSKGYTGHSHWPNQSRISSHSTRELGNRHDTQKIYASQWYALLVACLSWWVCHPRMVQKCENSAACADPTASRHRNQQSAQQTRSSIKLCHVALQIPESNPGTEVGFYNGNHSISSSNQMFVSQHDDTSPSPNACAHTKVPLCVLKPSPSYLQRPAWKDLAEAVVISSCLRVLLLFKFCRKGGGSLLAPGKLHNS